MKTCATCQYYELYQMVTSGRPYSYSGDIPCMRCERLQHQKDEYVENTKIKNATYLKESDK